MNETENKNDRENETDKESRALRFWKGPGPWIVVAALLIPSVYVGLVNPGLLGQRLSAVLSIAGAGVAFIFLTTAGRVRKALKQAAERSAQPNAPEGGAPADGQDKAPDEEEYEFPFLRLMDTRSRLYLCFETRSWYAIQFQTVATPGAHGDRMTPSWYPADVDHDYATKQDIWIAKSDLVEYELDPFPVANLPWKNSGALTLKTPTAKYSFALLGDVDEDELDDFFQK